MPFPSRSFFGFRVEFLENRWGLKFGVVAFCKFQGRCFCSFLKRHYKKQGVVAAFFLSQIYRSWGLTAHRGWADRMSVV